ncbi:MAG: prepilin-type N-terminal cleavage/methylation domain-containing protein [Coriobacteriia bacterium]|nr:prepilin-type N-terminal cleavage/methylation domain-containing protein [Coriobacteriia bacterium]
MDDPVPGKKTDNGFTIVELTVVLLLMAILMLIAIASFSSSSGRASEAACLSNQRVLSTAISLYRADNDGEAPETFDDLRPYARDVDKARFCPSDGTTELILDTTCDQVTCPKHPR